MLVMPFSSVVLLCRVHVKTECDRLDSLFMFVSPTLLAAWPLANSCTTSSTAAQNPTRQSQHISRNDGFDMGRCMVYKMLAQQDSHKSYVV